MKMKAILMCITTACLSAGCSRGLPPSQAGFSAKVAELRMAVAKAKDSGNAANVSKAEAAAITFLQKTQHQADGWRGQVEGVKPNGDETWIEAIQGEQKFHIRVADPKVKAWADSRTRGEEIEFSGDMGHERSLTLSGGLSEPEFTFWPSRIRLTKEAAHQEQDAQIMQAAAAQERQRVYDSQAEAEIATVCQEAVLAKLVLPNQASFSWLRQGAAKTSPDLWTYTSAVDAKNRMGATVTHRFICNAKVTPGPNGEPTANVAALVFR